MNSDFLRDKAIETQCVQAGYYPENQDARVMPIVQSTTYKFDTADELGDVFDLKVAANMYTRLGNPTLNWLEAGQEGIVVTESTPFYGEGGGQVGDTGLLWTDLGRAQVKDAKKTPGGAVLHMVEVEEGTLRPNDTATLTIDAKRRNATKKNHSATHLLHKALRDVLGAHVDQAGSYVDHTRLRFDFTHYEAIAKEDLERIEAIVNEKIGESLPVTAREMSLSQANEEGAIGLFEDKYQETVRVLSMGDYSKELCGGTHVDNTAQIQMFHILSETGVSAGVRRIEAITGPAVLHLLHAQEKAMAHIAQVLKTQPAGLEDKARQLMEENRQKQKEIEKLRRTGAVDHTADILATKKEVAGTYAVYGRADDLPMEQLRELADRVRDTIGTGVVAVGGVHENKVLFAVAVSKDIAGKTMHAGNIVREMAKLTGGNGGGRPDMATAGGKDPTAVDFALQSVYAIIKELNE
jgi:alanyl-tRNA synthetase